MENKEDIFNDLEEEISGNWENIQYKVRNKELEEDIKNKKITRINFPSFKKFYNLLYKIYVKNKTESKELYEVLGRMFCNGFGEEMPKFFNKLWEMLCSPYEYHSIIYKCHNCNKSYEVLYEIVIYNNFNFNFNYNMNETKKCHKKFHCFNCGNVFPINDYYKIIGIFKYK